MSGGRWDHATLDEVVRRRNGFMNSWGEVIDEMRAESPGGIVRVDTTSDETVTLVARAVAAEQHCMHLNELPDDFPTDLGVGRAVLAALKARRG